MLRLGLVLLSATALLGPASAGPTPFSTTVPITLDGRSECTRATGTPGEVMTSNPEGAQFVHASRDGLVTGERVELGGPLEFSCARAESRPNGAGVVAGAPQSEGVYVAVRAPGRTWGALVQLASDDDEWVDDDVSVGVSDRGDAIVVWNEVRVTAQGTRLNRVRASRRPAGGSFGAPEVLSRQRHPALMAAIAANGDAVVLWTTAVPNHLPLRQTVHVALAQSGGAFAPAVNVGELRPPSTPALAMGADGHALVAFGGKTSLLVAERAPGQPFGALAPVPGADDPLGVQPTAALGAAGGAAVAWSGIGLGGIGIVTRTGPGAFLPAGRRCPPQRRDRAPGPRRNGPAVSGCPLAVNAPPRRGRIRIRVTYAAMGGPPTGSRTLTLPVARRDTAPPLRMIAFRAVRRGERIVVRWSFDRPMDGSFYFVTGFATRDFNGEPLSETDFPSHDLRRSFSATLPANPDVRWVALHFSAESELRRQLVRVSG
jgi:hypothetical protein